jgi:4-diphosphocytidyl-2-C-methyl-D-erythritol kinase
MLRLTARAKINWTLDITGRRQDGYHLMDMLMQTVELHDTLWVEEAETLSLENGYGSVVSKMGDDRESASPVPYDENNLVIKAANALKRHCGVEKGARFILKKGIPSGAGMGGGSADAAAALVGLNTLWNLGLNMEQLKEIGLSIGADVPFMLGGGLARVQGIGEKIMPLMNPPVAWLAFWQPCDGLSTKEIFTAFDSMDPSGILHPDTDGAQQGLLEGDLPLVCSKLQNVLQPISEAKRPAIGQAVRHFLDAGVTIGSPYIDHG